MIINVLYNPQFVSVTHVFVTVAKLLNIKLKIGCIGCIHNKYHLVVFIIIYIDK